MKHILLSILLLAGTQSAAAGPAGGSAASTPAEAQCTAVLKDDDFMPGSAALEALARQACGAQPDLCAPDTANREAFLRLNAELLAESSKISRSALEAFFKQGPQPNQCEFYELGYIFDTLLLKRISDTVCAGAGPALEKVQRLTDWTFEHVAVSSPLQKQRARTQPVYPLDIIERGYGLDFQISWALAALVQQQGLAVALAYLPTKEGDAALSPVLVLVFLEAGSVFVDPARGLVWQDPATRTPIGIRQAQEQPGLVAGLHSQYGPDMAASVPKASLRIPYHPLALLPKMKTVQSVLAGTCGAHPLLYVDIAHAHTTFGHLFCKAEGLESFSYNPELMEFSLPGRSYSCSVWLLPLVQLFALGVQDAPYYREARRMHLRAEYDQASLGYRRALAAAEEPEQRADLTFFLGLLEYDRKNYKQAAFVLQRYLDRYYKARQDQVRFLLARIYQGEGDRGKSDAFMELLRGDPRYERFLRR